jgi:hypothetical protein
MVNSEILSRRSFGVIAGNHEKPIRLPGQRSELGTSQIWSALTIYKQNDVSFLISLSFKATSTAVSFLGCYKVCTSVPDLRHVYTRAGITGSLT